MNACCGSLRALVMRKLQGYDRNIYSEIASDKACTRQRLISYLIYIFICRTHLIYPILSHNSLCSLSTHSVALHSISVAYFAALITCPQLPLAINKPQQHMLAIIVAVVLLHACQLL